MEELVEVLHQWHMGRSISQMYLFSAYSAIKILYLGDSAIEIGIQGHTPDQVRGKLVDLSQM